MLRGSVRGATGPVQASRVVPQASSAPGRIVLAAVREDVGPHRVAQAEFAAKADELVCTFVAADNEQGGAAQMGADDGDWIARHRGVDGAMGR